MQFTERTAIKGFEIAAGPPGRFAISLANGLFEPTLSTPHESSYFSRKTLAICVVILQDGIATLWGRHRVFRRGSKCGNMQTEGFGDAEIDRRQFVEEFSRHSRRLYGYILSLTMNRNDAEEVFQTTSIVLYRKYAQFEPISASFYTWACRVAYLEVLYFRRTRKRDSLLTERALELLHDGMIRRSDEFEQREEALEKCLKKLSEPDRTLIAERYYNDLAPKQIAERFGRSINSVYRSLARIHDMLRGCVNRTLAYGE